MTQSNSNIYLQALLNRDEKLILKIYKEMLPKVTSFVKNNKGTQEDAQEVFQKGLYQLTARVKVQKFEAYLFTACKNLWRRELNNHQKEVRNDGGLVSEDQDNSEAILEQERWELFEEKIASLTENCR
ncbi:MAG: RNA polymerase subunit sigma, partial [Kordia sp.]